MGHGELFTESSWVNIAGQELWRQVVPFSVYVKCSVKVEVRAVGRVWYHSSDIATPS